jgi:OOP family OmpA-OmpF porin
VISRRTPSSTRLIGIAVAVLLFCVGVFIVLSGRKSDKPEETTAEARPAAHVLPAKLPPLRIRRSSSGDTVISLDSDVYFAFDRARLTRAARSQLRSEVLPRVITLLARPGARVDLRGYTDGVGDAAYNKGLSLRRAEAARSFLVAAGAPPAGLSAAGFGEELATSSERNQALRRVDIVLRKGEAR